MTIAVLWATEYLPFNVVTREGYGRPAGLPPPHMSKKEEPKFTPHDGVPDHLVAQASPWTRPTAGYEVHSMPNIPYDYSITFT